MGKTSAKRSDGMPSRVASKLMGATCAHAKARIEPLVAQWKRKRRALPKKHGDELGTGLADLWLLIVTARINRCGSCKQRTKVRKVPKSRGLPRFLTASAAC